jgi:hypothetical protein
VGGYPNGMEWLNEWKNKKQKQIKFTGGSLTAKLPIGGRWTIKDNKTMWGRRWSNEFRDRLAINGGWTSKIKTDQRRKVHIFGGIWHKIEWKN